ncbi:MAG: adenylate kinase [Chloroflexi bacterium]|nr:adenylate kinase [Chloroflexota bacterium]
MSHGRPGDLILMGPPGVGKGTQARLLVDRNGWVQLATGDIFRDHLRRKTPLGELAASYMYKGSYVPDDVTVGMVRERIAEIPRETRVMFDGFPRTVAQAEALDEILAKQGRAIGRVILLDVPRDELLDRLASRATCSICQAVYSTGHPPKAPGICDRCGGAVVATARPDDSPDVVRKRLEVYSDQTEPVVRFYDARGLVRRVDGVGDVEDVIKRLLEAAA